MESQKYLIVSLMLLMGVGYGQGQDIATCTQQLLNDFTGDFCAAFRDYVVCVVPLVGPGQMDDFINALQQQYDADGITAACSINVRDVVTMLNNPTATTTTTTMSTTTTTMSTTTTFQLPPCVANVAGACFPHTDGDYPACGSLCQDGYYMSCVAGELYIRECALGWYRNSTGDLETARLVYDPRRQACQYRSMFCPRPLDFDALF